MKSIVLPSCYFPNLYYFKYIIEAKEVWIDDNEIYLKQSFRNRCQIMAANGVLDLSIPIVGLKGKELNTKEITIAYDDNWPLKHWRSIRSAYKSAPFFEEYEQEFEKVILEAGDSLIDLNKKILSLCLDNLAITTPLYYSSENSINPEAVSLKGHFKPSKMPAEHKSLPSYLQVFNYKYDFVPNLSILDLLFNEGPYAHEYLLNSNS